MRITSGSAFRARVIAFALCLLSSCGGSGGGGGSTPITSFELLDPTPGAGDRFGSQVVILPNGNIVVTDPGDSSVVASNGAVHLYNPATQTRVASVYGDNANDSLGSGGVAALANGNFVIRSPSDDVGGVVDAGSVMLINGSTGALIATQSGNSANDSLASRSAIGLPNSNYVIASPLDDVGGVADAGSVMLVNGATGAVISTLSGDNVNDQVGSFTTALANGNYLIVSVNDDVGGVVDAGSVLLVNGVTGALIATLAGDNSIDFVGLGGIRELSNGNFVVASSNDDVGGVLNAGSVTLVNGTTGAVIVTLAGDNLNDQFGTFVTELPNGNFAIASPLDDVGGVTDAGSVTLVDGTTGAVIDALSGDNASDFFGLSVRPLSNGNFVIGSQGDDVGGVVNAGSVTLVNGTTGAVIATLAGDNTDDAFGSNVVALSNGNFVIGSPDDDVGGVMDAGSVMLVDGATGSQIGSPLAGDNAFDSLGLSVGGVTALSNGNYVIPSAFDDVAGVSDAGSVILVDGMTGVQIGSTFAGDNVDDQIGTSGISLSSGNYLIVSEGDDVNGVVDAGSVTLVDGTTGAQIGGTIVGEASGDVTGARVTGSEAGNYFVLALPFADKNGLADSGLVRLIAP